MSDHAESAAPDEQHHHEMPTEGKALTSVAFSATLHCLTGCAIGEIAGLAIGTALGFTNFQTVILAVGLAFLFGYGLTSLPLLRAGFALGAVIPIALASDTISIATMEIIDNVIMLVVPGAMEAGLSDVLFWGALSVALALAFVVAVPVNRWLISKGKGHVAVHNTGIHGGPPPRLVGTVLVAAAIFGTTVLAARAATNGDENHGAHEEGMAMAVPGTVRGVAVAEGGLQIKLGQAELTRGKESKLTFQIVGEDGSAVTDFEVEHVRKMHLIVVRRDLTGFQHLHPKMADDGTWSTQIELPAAGSYRVFADFNHSGDTVTLGSDLAVDGDADYEALQVQKTETETSTGGYAVGVEGEAATAGEESELTFNVVRDGELVDVEPYLGADGHLVALREGDLAFLHVHPIGSASDGDTGIRFRTEFPSEGRYRLFLQFKDQGEVHTAEFTREVGR